jgi:hypothetical protein
VLGSSFLFLCRSLFLPGGVMTDYVLYVRVEVVHTNRIGDTPMRAVAGAEMPAGVAVSEQQKNASPKDARVGFYLSKSAWVQRVR